MKPWCLTALAVAFLMNLANAADSAGVKEAEVLLQRVKVLKSKAKWQEAIEVSGKLVQKVQKVFGSRHPFVAAQMFNLAELYEGRGRYDKAEPLYKESLAIRVAVLGKDHLDVAASLNNLAHLYQRRGQYDRAERLYQRSLTIRQARLGLKHSDVAMSMNNLAHLYWQQGRHDRADFFYRRSLAIYEERPGKNNADLATGLNNLAALAEDVGQYADAETLYARSLKLREKGQGKEHAATAESLTNLANLYQRMGQYGKAEALYLRGLQIRESVLGKNHTDVGNSLNNLAHLYRKMGDSPRAEPLYRRALDIQEAALGADHPVVAGILDNLATLYRNLDRPTEAEPLYLRALRIFEAKLGPDHPSTATSLHGLASLYREMGRHARAEPLSRRSLHIRVTRLGQNHPDVAQSLNNLALLTANAGRSREAAPLFDRAQRTTRRHAGLVLPVLSEREQASFLKTSFTRRFETALSLSWQLPDDDRLAARSASWLLNGKAVALEALAFPALLARDSRDGAVGKLTQKLLTLRQRLARLSFASVLPEREKGRRKLLDELAVQEEELAKQLRRAGSVAVTPEPWVELSAVRRVLPSDTILIDVVRFTGFDFQPAAREKRWSAPRYAAWVTPATGPVRRIDLGPAVRIDEAVRRLRLGLQDAKAAVKADGEEKAEQRLRVALTALSRLVLRPLLPFIEKSKRWVISPDGNLWLAPWEALLLPGGQFAIEKHSIRYLTSGRDLLPLDVSRVKPSAPLVLADPDFDRVSVKRRSAVPEGASARGAFRLGRAQRLINTGDEARAIAPSLKSYTGMVPRVYLRGEARETVFKAPRNPRIVVLSTHGFFLPEDDRTPNGKSGAGKAKAVRRWESPLLRCGLLLAGCNNAGKALGADDGVLTGLEVVGVDLRGCELVVLSACDTGLGEVQSGEGVAGLRQAFQIAGAHSVVSTLWQVPSASSARLMGLFFQKLAQGAKKGEALRQAKLQIIAERRSDFAAAHPFFWAAFTLTGES